MIETVGWVLVGLLVAGCFVLLVYTVIQQELDLRAWTRKHANCGRRTDSAGNVYCDGHNEFLGNLEPDRMEDEIR